MLEINPKLIGHHFAEESACKGVYAPLLWGLALVLAVACQPTEQRAVAVQAVVHPTLLPVDGKILAKNRRFVYIVRWSSPNAGVDTVTMTAAATPLPIEPTQTLIVWLFTADTLRSARPRQGVGAIENKTEFWLHPPRYGRYRILELNPFPHIKLPVVNGHTWEWQVYPPELYADSAWASWKGILTVQFRYTLTGTRQLITPFGRLSCAHVQAKGHSKLGTTALEAYFHPRYGFVRLNYHNIDASRVQLELLTVDTSPDSSRKALERLFLRSYSMTKQAKKPF